MLALGEEQIIHMRVRRLMFLRGFMPMSAEPLHDYFWRQIILINQFKRTEYID